MNNLPLLSICIPAYNRPQWLGRALDSIGKVSANFYPEIEVIISDDSSDITCQEIAASFLEQWSGTGEYRANSPRLGMAANWNNSIKMARGKYIIILHDDDFLVAEGIENLLKSIKANLGKYAVLLSGVKVVDERERILKIQTFNCEQYLSPQEALLKLLSNSSLVRFPAICIQRHVFNEVGYFNLQWGEPTDLDMWIRLFSRYGVYCVPTVTCAYTVHAQALTMGVFKEETVITLIGFFEQVRVSNILSEEQLKNCQSQFFHQFILAGAWRMLRRGRLREFNEVMGLFKLPSLQNLQAPRKWIVVRIVLSMVNKFLEITQKPL